jgi:pimeloyl-[acyl-carrier protein] synthase
MDVVADYSEPLTDCMIGELLGLPRADQSEFIKWCELIRKFMAAKRQGHETILMAKAAAKAVRRVRGYVRSMIFDRRANFIDDLIGHILAVEGNEAPATEDEILANCVFFLNAGARNMSASIANALATLLRHPKQFALLHQHPQSITSAVEELLRYETPVHVAIRGVLEQIEFAGRKIGPQQLLILLLGAANRDPEQFAEPDRLDLNRRPNHHLSFGLGSHGCVGGLMARFGMTTAIEAILLRQTRLRLAVRNLEWNPSPMRRTVRSLPVLVTPRSQVDVVCRHSRKSCRAINRLSLS